MNLFFSMVYRVFWKGALALMRLGLRRVDGELHPSDDELPPSHVMARDFTRKAIGYACAVFWALVIQLGKIRFCSSKVVWGFISKGFTGFGHSRAILH